MKILYTFLGVLIAFAMQTHAQTLSIHSADKTINQKIQLSAIDSITIDKCDSVIYDLDGCDVDIDSIDVGIHCDSINLLAHIEGMPSIIRWTIYDVDGNAVLVLNGSPSVSFTLPTHGSYYGTLEVSCGGGERNGGDEDEDAFEIDYNLPTAHFDLTAHTRASGSGFVLDLMPENLSDGSGPMYDWTVIDSANGATVGTSTLENPVFSGLNATKTYTILLDMTDDKGCRNQYQITRTATFSCTPDFTFEYSWCQDQRGTDNVPVTFSNISTFLPTTSTTVKYYWDFGDNSPIDSVNEAPVHTYACASPAQSFSVSLTIIVVLTNPDATTDTCRNITSRAVSVVVDGPDFSVMTCCDGRVVFCTSALAGKWETPGDMNLCNASTCKFIRPHLSGRVCGLQTATSGYCGQTYWRYYEHPGVYNVTLFARSWAHNRCSKTREFHLDSVICYNRNVRESQDVSFDGYDFRIKFKVIQFPFTHRIIAKIKARGHKKMNEISAEFAGTVNTLGSNGCFCEPGHAGDTTVNINKRKAKAKINRTGRIRVGQNMMTATFRVKTPHNLVNTWTIQLGKPPCDRPCILWF
ncbi:MAG: hypothetical protein JWQ98_2713 [Chlorobi bacterium]|nr:hypothetical protein [Chlorobiota bacterium]